MKQSLPEKDTSRLETFSDGVIAIAMTLLILNVIAIADINPQNGNLTEELLRQWPTYLAFFVGFFSILVCWINHHQVFRYIKRSNSVLPVINGLLLLAVTIVPFSTVVLSKYIMQPQRQTAIALYGLTFILMGCSYKLLWSYSMSRKLIDVSSDLEQLKAINLMYTIGVIYTIVSLAISYLNIYAAVILYSVLFAIYTFPAVFARQLLNLNKRDQGRVLLINKS